MEACSIWMPAAVFLHLCRSWMLILPVTRALSALPWGPLPGTGPISFSFSFFKKKLCMKNKQTPKNQAEKPTCYEAVSLHRDTSKTNAARRPQTSFVPSHRLTKITQLGFFFLFFLFRERERESNRERQRKKVNEK